MERKIIIGLTGTLGAGKGTMAEYIKQKGFKHYLDWFYTKWTGKPDTEKVLEFQERLMKSGFWWPAA